MTGVQTCALPIWREGRASAPTGDATRDRIGQALGILIGLVATGFIVWLVVWALGKAVAGDFLYISYIAIIVALFVIAVLWIRRADQRSQAQPARASGG